MVTGRRAWCAVAVAAGGAVWAGGGAWGRVGGGRRKLAAWLARGGDVVDDAASGDLVWTPRGDPAALLTRQGGAPFGLLRCRGGDRCECEVDGEPVAFRVRVRAGRGARTG